MLPQHLSIKDFDYWLPEEKIAAFPLPERDQSKLLIYDNGVLVEDIFLHVAAHLPPSAFLVFNDTKVINARILFAKDTGAVIEIFCLEPQETCNDFGVVLQKSGSVRWKCMIGGAGKWKQKYLEKKVMIDGDAVLLTAELVEKSTDAYVVVLSWQPPQYSFAEIIGVAGTTPLPPYIKREAAASDLTRYQTIYSKYEGSVAAPTAGLHFTERIFASLQHKGIGTGFVTLHVGAGTFKPVKSETMEGHAMHAEWMDVSTGLIERLIFEVDRAVFCVGTTSVRTIESIYWMGLKAFLFPAATVEELEIKQWEVYEPGLANHACSPGEALQALLHWLSKNKMTRIFLRTEIIIVPGYRFRIVQGMITNFHQPKSTLLLLVAAMAGQDWKHIYDYALVHQFRFLSYGDGCLIFRDTARTGTEAPITH